MKRNIFDFLYLFIFTGILLFFILEFNQLGKEAEKTSNDVVLEDINISK